MTATEEEEEEEEEEEQEEEEEGGRGLGLLSVLCGCVLGRIYPQRTHIYLQHQHLTLITTQHTLL